MAIGLIGVSFPWIETVDLARRVLEALKNVVEVIEITSLMKRRSQSASDFDSTIEFVIAISTLMPSHVLASKCLEISKKVERKRSDSHVHLELLVYDREVLMTPELTLPHPSLQYDALTLRLSCEIWSRYEHPILKKTLRELADSRSQDLDVEFVMQGQNLLD